MLVGDSGRFGNITMSEREHLMNVASFKILNEPLFGMLKRFEKRRLRKPDIGGFDRFVLRMRHGTLYHIAQLPHIPWPVVKYELMHSSQRKVLDAFLGVL